MRKNTVSICKYEKQANVRQRPIFEGCKNKLVLTRISAQKF